jgi:RNA polymerase sigma factor (sigma-70 family)
MESCTVCDVNLDDLVRRAQAGDHEALDALMIWAMDQLWVYFRKRFQEQDAADLVQDASVVLLTKLHAFESEHANSFAHYVMRVARLHAMSWRREGARAWGRRVKLGERVVPSTRGPASRVEAKQRQELLTRCMALLPDKYRRALEHEFAGGDNESFARNEGLTLSAARSRRFRGHQLLDALLLDARLTPAQSTPRSPSTS